MFCNPSLALAVILGAYFCNAQVINGIQFPELNDNSGNPLGWRYIAPAPSSTADQRGRISCVGDFPPFNLPRSLINEEFSSLVHICAHHSYGGKQGMNVGGYCAWFLDRPRIAFDRDTASRWWHMPDFSVSRRIVMYCQTKCECVSPGLESDKKFIMKRHPIVYEVDFRVGLEIQIPLEEFDLATRKFATALYYPLGNIAGSETIRFRETIITGGKETEITCSGRLPPLRYMPTQLMLFVYPDLHNLCAATLVGGHNTSNAGGHCIPFLSGSEERARPDPTWPLVPTFPDEFSPHALTLDNMPKGLAVMLWCTRHCWCPHAKRAQSRQPSRYIRWLWNSQVDFSNGGLTIKGEIKNPSRANQAFTMTVIRSEEDNQQQLGMTAVAAGACASASDCLNEWPSGIPTPVLPALPVVREGAKLEPPLPTPRFETLPRCGASCSSNEECAGGASDCRCVVNPSTPIYGGIVPLSQATVTQCLLLTRFWRETKRMGGKRGLEWSAICACNTTYVSRGCCVAPNGIVWEDRSLREGSLKVKRVGPG